jgi:hypothetical protein
MVLKPKNVSDSQNKKKSQNEANKPSESTDLDKELNELIEKNESLKSGVAKLFEGIKKQPNTNKSQM